MMPAFFLSSTCVYYPAYAVQVPEIILIICPGSQLFF